MAFEAGDAGVEGAPCGFLVEEGAEETAAGEGAGEGVEEGGGCDGGGEGRGGEDSVEGEG